MNDSQLRSFLVIADCGSFSQAENILFLSKQALKKQMDALEDELQCPLFIRSPQGIQLTPAGKAFLSAAPRILREMTNSVTFCRQAHLQRHPVRISLPNHPAPLLPEATWRFCRENPDILVQFRFYEHSDAISPPQQILDGDSDIFLVTLNLHSAQPVEYTPLLRLPYVCLLPPDHPLAQGNTAIAPELLYGYPVTISRFSWTPELLEALSPHCDLSVREEATAPELELAYNTCLAGGVFITTAYHSSCMPPLVAIPLAIPIHRELGLLYSATAPEQVRRYVRGIKEFLPTERGPSV